MKNKKALLTILVLIIIGAIIGITYALINKADKEEPKKEQNSFNVVAHGYTAEYHENEYKYKDQYIEDYDTYKKLMEDIDLNTKLTKEDFEKHSYLVLAVPMVECAEEIAGVNSITLEGNTLTAVFDVEYYCGLCVPADDLYLVEFDKDDVIKDIKVVYEYNEVHRELCEPNVDYKPIIYLYPKTTTEVIVRLAYPEKLTTTYPKYEAEWYVSAKPNGDLVDLNTGRNLYGLYWEGLNTVSEGVQEEGFVVKGEDTIEFLEEKLALLGLTEREANEFIIYWLPILEANEYNYIRFQTMEEINENMPLEIRPTPDTIIRVLMEFKGLDAPIEVKEQQLVTPTRTGFTVVEWGGTELN